MWQHQSPPQSGGEVQIHMTCGSAGVHLNQEARSEAIGHMTALEPTSAWRWGPEPRGMWQHQSPPQMWGEVRSHMTCGSTGAHLSSEREVQSHRARGSAWMHALPLVLTWSLYVGVLGLQGTDSGPWGHLRRGYEPAGGANSSAPDRLSWFFLLRNVLLIVPPWEALPEILKWLPLSCRTLMTRSLECGAGDPVAPTINAKKHRRWAPWWVLMQIREHPPST
jgi:hypothetical protein